MFPKERHPASRLREGVQRPVRTAAVLRAAGAGWLAGWLAGWIGLACWLAGWLAAGWLALVLCTIVRSTPVGT